MQAQYTNSYVNKNGKRIFVHTITGTAEELAKYKTSKKEFYVENEKKEPLFFSTNFHAQKFNMIQNKEGNFFPNTEEIEIMNNLVKQSGFELGMHRFNQLKVKEAEVSA